MSYKLPPQRPEALAEAHPCAAPQCSALVSPGHIACRRHWRQVPQDLRDPLVMVFRKREANPAAFTLACRIARRLVHEHAGLVRA